MSKKLHIILILLMAITLFSCDKKEESQTDYNLPELTLPRDSDACAGAGDTTATEPKKSIPTEHYTPAPSRHSNYQSHKNSYGDEEIIGFDDDVDDDDDMELYMTDYD